MIAVISNKKYGGGEKNCIGLRHHLTQLVKTLPRTMCDYLLPMINTALVPSKRATDEAVGKQDVSYMLQCRDDNVVAAARGDMRIVMIDASPIKGKNYQMMYSVIVNGQKLAFAADVALKMKLLAVSGFDSTCLHSAPWRPGFGRRFGHGSLWLMLVSMSGLGS